MTVAGLAPANGPPVTSESGTDSANAVSPAAGAQLLDPATAGRRSRRRRPSGRPPPLPHPLHTTGVGWITASVVLMVLSVVVFGGGLRRAAVPVTAVEDAIVGWIAGLDGPGVSATMEVLAAPASWVTITVLLWSLLLAMLITKRLRHLVVVVIAWTLQGFIIQYVLGPSLRRPRPFGVVFRTDWYAWALPSEQMAALTVTLVAILYGLVPEGRWRQTGKWTAAAVIGLTALARIHLGVDAPSDVIVAVVIGVTIPLLGFRLFTPNDAFPVTYRRRRRRPPGRRRRPGTGDPPGAGGPTRVDRRNGRTVRSGRLGRVRHRCASRSKATRTAGCSPSSTPAATCAPTAGTSSAGSCCMAGWRTRSRSTPSGGWSSKRTTPCTSCTSPDCPRPGRMASSSSAPSGNTCSSPSSSPTPPSSARPRSTTASSTTACCSSASCGTPVWPTATSSRPTCSSATVTWC